MYGVTGKVSAQQSAQASWQFLLFFARRCACTLWFVPGPCFWNSCNMSYSCKKPLDSAVVHSSKSKDHSPAFVDKHWYHPVYKSDVTRSRGMSHMSAIFNFEFSTLITCPFKNAIFWSKPHFNRTSGCGNMNIPWSLKTMKNIRICHLF